MPRRLARGFTLVEVMVATTIAVVLLFATIEIYLGITADSLRNQLENEATEICRRALNQVKEDVESAGFGANATGVAFLPAAEAIIGGIRLRCLKDIGELSADALQGAVELTVNDADLFPVNSLLLYSYQGNTAFTRITAVDRAANQVELADGLIVALPAGTWLAVVHVIDYIIQDRRLIRVLNGGAAATLAEVVEDGSGFTLVNAAGFTVTQVNQDENAWLIFMLNLTRQRRIRGRLMEAHADISQRVALLGAQPAN